ncbi:hypothetical protein ACH4UV_31600 [Streptomyces sp. NPDC020802]|uniref:hypothetical protein n=1 Tax=Streptomyces sp. NPDC020802 TaxID=3365094 RepID=UPI00379218AF
MSRTPLQVRRTNTGLAVRATVAGTYRTVLSDGRTARTSFKDVPQPRELASWRPRVQDRRPRASATPTTVVDGEDRIG